MQEWRMWLRLVTKPALIFWFLQTCSIFLAQTWLIFVVWNISQTLPVWRHMLAGSTLLLLGFNVFTHMVLRFRIAHLESTYSVINILMIDAVLLTHTFFLLGIISLYFGNPYMISLSFAWFLLKIHQLRIPNIDRIMERGESWWIYIFYIFSFVYLLHYLMSCLFLFIIFVN